MARSWRVLLLVLALHYLTFILLSTQNSLLRPEKLEEMVINLSLPTIVPKGITEGFKEGREEIKHILPAAVEQFIIKPSETVQPNDASPNIEIAPVIKPKVEPIRPTPIEKVQEKKVQETIVERVEEKKVPTLVVEKVEEKKVQATVVDKVEEKKVQAPVVEKVEEKKVQPQPVLEETVAPTLPALVDKKNKEKDAPEIAKPSQAASSSSAGSSDPSKSSSPSASSSPPSSSSSAQSATSSASSAPEMQAQISGSKPPALGVPAGNLLTADADYKAEEFRNPAPQYPPYARKMRQEGTVTLLVEVLASGRARSIRIVSSSGSELLDQSASETIKQWTFRPAKINGVAYTQTIRIPIVFNLNGK